MRGVLYFFVFLLWRMRVGEFRDGEVGGSCDVFHDPQLRMIPPASSTFWILYSLRQI